MISKTYKTYEEADKAAHSFLLAERPPRDGEQVTITSTYSEYLKVMNTQPYIITIDGSEAFAVILHNKAEFDGREYEHAFLCCISEKDSFTYPFRFMDKKAIPFLLLCRMNGALSLIKPNEDITAEEATTIQGGERLRNFFDMADETEEQRKKIADIKAGGEAFTLWDDEDGTKPYYDSPDISPVILSEETGKQIRSLRQYQTAMEKLIGRKLNDEEKESLRFPYYVYQTELFSHYCLYRFLFMEKYSALQEAAKDYAIFGLPKDWEKREEYRGITLEGNETLEEWVLSNYFNSETYELFTPISLDEIARWTETPPRILRHCSGESRDKRIIRSRYREIDND